jgi:hypothetical protein
MQFTGDFGLSPREPVPRIFVVWGEEGTEQISSNDISYDFDGGRGTWTASHSFTTLGPKIISVEIRYLDVTGASRTISEQLTVDVVEPHITLELSDSLINWGDKLFVTGFINSGAESMHCVILDWGNGYRTVLQDGQIYEGIFYNTPTGEGAWFLGSHPFDQVGTYTITATQGSANRFDSIIGCNGVGSSEIGIVQVGRHQTVLHLDSIGGIGPGDTINITGRLLDKYTNSGIGGRVVTVSGLGVESFQNREVLTSSDGSFLISGRSPSNTKSVNSILAAFAGDEFYIPTTERGEYNLRTIDQGPPIIYYILPLVGALTVGVIYAIHRGSNDGPRENEERGKVSTDWYFDFGIENEDEIRTRNEDFAKYVEHADEDERKDPFILMKETVLSSKDDVENALEAIKLDEHLSILCKEGSKDPDQLISEIANEHLETLLDYLAPIYSGYLVRNVTVQSEIQLLKNSEEGRKISSSVDIEMEPLKPFIEVGLKVNGTPSKSVRIVFLLQVSANAENAELRIDRDKRVLVSLDDIVVHLRLSLYGLSSRGILRYYVGYMSQTLAGWIKPIETEYRLSSIMNKDKVPMKSESVERSSLGPIDSGDLSNTFMREEKYCHICRKLVKALRFCHECKNRISS